MKLVLFLILLCILLEIYSGKRVPSQHRRAPTINRNMAKSGSPFPRKNGRNKIGNGKSVNEKSLSKTFASKSLSRKGNLSKYYSNSNSAPVRTTENFQQKHTIPKRMFKRIFIKENKNKKMSKTDHFNIRLQRLPWDRKNPLNTVIKVDDIKLLSKENSKRVKVINNEKKSNNEEIVYMTKNKIDYITVDRKPGQMKIAEMGSKPIAFGIDKNGNVNHLAAVQGSRIKDITIIPME